MVNQTGTYFKERYTNLMSQSPKFPSDDPSPNFQACIEQPNFVRAEMLARQHNLSSEILISLQELAILQFLVDYQNAPGLVKLTKQFNMTPAEYHRILGLIKQEKDYPCFSFSKATEQGINESWATQYVPIERKVEALIKPRVRWFDWILRLFGKK